MQLVASWWFFLCVQLKVYLSKEANMAEKTSETQKMTLGEKVTYGALGFILTSPAFAEGGFGDAVVTSVSSQNEEVMKVGGAVIAVVALIFGFRTVKRLIGG